MATTVKFVSVPSKTLAASINASATSIQLSDIKGWDGNNLAAANFGDVLWAVLRNSTNTQMEIMKLDPTTIAATSITILKRGLDFSGDPTTEYTVNKLTWIKNDTIVELGSNPPPLLNQAVCVTGNQTIADLKIFTTMPQCSVAPLAGADLVNKTYADGLAIAGSPDSSTTTKGILKLSVAPVSPTSPIAVGDNDGRVPTQGENDALVGNNTSIAIGTGNKFVSQTGLQNRAETYAASTGSANAYVLTLAPIPTALVAGQEFEFKANFTNSGACTLNVNSLGAIAIKKLDGATALASGDIVSGQMVKVKYDGTNFQMLTPIANLPTVHKFVQIISAVTPANDTNENTVFTMSLAAGLLSISGGVFVRIQVDASSAPATGSTYTLRLKYGGSTIATCTVTFTAVGGGNGIGGSGVIEGWIFANAATNAQKGMLLAMFGFNGASSTNQVWPAGGSGVGTAAVDSTASQTLTLTQQKSATFGTLTYNLGSIVVIN